MNPIRALQPYFPKIHFISLPPTTWLPPSGSSNKIFVRISHKQWKKSLNKYSSNHILTNTNFLSLLLLAGIRHNSRTSVRTICTYISVYQEHLCHCCFQRKQHGTQARISDVMGWLATLIRWEKIKKTITELLVYFTFKSPHQIQVVLNI
jgi:hypothetical protein